MKRAVLVGLCLLAASAAHAQLRDPTLYTLHCSGCHGADGHGAPASGIPDLAQSGGYAIVPQGRAYLAQVPGIAQSRLDDATAARLLNYVLRHYSATTLPANFVPYSAIEVGKLRANTASDAETRRNAVLAAMAARSR
jgi:mono/diheme cytochrome c family protein